MGSQKGCHVVLRVNQQITAEVLGRAYLMDMGIKGDPGRFPSPPVPVADFHAQITALEGAEKLTGTRTLGAAAARNVERSKLYSMMKSQLAYVQVVCDGCTFEEGALVAASAGVEVALVTTAAKPLLAAYAGPAPDAVKVVANATLLAGKRTAPRFFNWQWSTDGGQTYTSAPSTTRASTILTGFAPLALITFRVSVTTSAGPGPWSAPVSFRLP